jgi:hypothetical protein
VSLKIYDRHEIAAGQSRYQIVQQPKFPTHGIVNDRRGDLMLARDILENWLTLSHAGKFHALFATHSTTAPCAPRLRIRSFFPFADFYNHAI